VTGRTQAHYLSAALTSGYPPKMIEALRADDPKFDAVMAELVAIKRLLHAIRALLTSPRERPAAPAGELTRDEIAAAIDGNVWLSQAAGAVGGPDALLDVLLAAIGGIQVTGRTPNLTRREAEIVRLVTSGLQHRQISDRLSISPRTVQNHLQNAMGKLQVHNRAELVRYALGHGLAGAGT
jgi:DNA-binding NarL/FixJ family response regulator